MKYYNVSIGSTQCYFCINEFGARQTFSVATSRMNEKKRYTINKPLELHELVVAARQEQARLLALAPVQKLILDRALRVKIAESAGADPLIVEHVRSGAMSPAETKLINLQVLIRTYEAWKNKTMLWEWRECSQDALDLIAAEEFVDAIYASTQAELEAFNNLAGIQ